MEEVIETSTETSLPPIAFLAEPIGVVIARVVSGMAVLLTSAMLDKLGRLASTRSGICTHSTGISTPKLKPLARRCCRAIKPTPHTFEYHGISGSDTRTLDGYRLIG